MLKGQVRSLGIVTRTHRDGPPLSFAQERLWSSRHLLAVINGLSEEELHHLLGAQPEEPISE